MEKEYWLGIMITPVETTGDEFRNLVSEAAKRVENLLNERIPNLKLDVFEFMGPHLTPVNGSYSSLELLRMGMIEKAERKPNFLLVITEVEISSYTRTYSVALPSVLTNVGVISMKRLDPRYWNAENSPEVTRNRLVGLMLHTIGYLLNLSSHEDPDNIMYPFDELEALETMRTLTSKQVDQIKKGLPEESRDLTARTPARLFILQRLIANSGAVVRTIKRTNPFRLAAEMTTMIAAAISLMIVLFFSPEMWDIGSTVDFYQFALFSLVSLIIATLVVYRSYPLRSIATHTRKVSETLVVTNAATLFTLFLTILVLNAAFWMLIYFGIFTFFPKRLMETWPTVDPAVRTIDHIKISTFISAMGTLVGSLGGRLENQNLIRRILFTNE